MSSVQSQLPVKDTADGTPGSAVPAVAQQVAGSDGTNLRTIKTDSTGIQIVQANAGTNLNTSALALDATVSGLQVAQSSTTSGEKGPLVQGAVTTAAPSYSTAQTNPLSLTTAGALRTDASATTQPVSGTVAATQSGTWTVQPGNTANTTAWLVSERVALTAASPTAASVGITSAQAVASNANRKSLVLINTSTARISIAFGSAAVLNSGITLYPGGVFVMDVFTFDTAAVNAIASVGTSNLAIQEYT